MMSRNRKRFRMIRFLHTADWQIGKPFGGFEPDVRAELRAERFAVVARIAALARDEGCAAILVAGDAFDDNTIGDRDIVRTLDAMAGFPGPWVMLPGNHDAALPVSVWTRIRAGGALPVDLRIADAPDITMLADGRLAVLAAPLTRRHEGQDVTDWFDRAETPAGAARVGLAHGAVANRLPEAAESGNPISDRRAETARLDYLALGDWHGFLEVAPRTVYSGTPEADRFTSNAPGHAALVEIALPGEGARVRRLDTGRLRWASLEVFVDNAVEALDEAMATLADPLRSLVSLKLAGTVSLHGRMAMQDRLSYWGSRLFALRTDESGLYDRPEAADFERMEISGFVRAAMERLRARAEDAADPQREAAALALRLAYVEHRRQQAAT